MQAWTDIFIFGLCTLNTEAVVLCFVSVEESFSLNYCAVSQQSITCPFVFFPFIWNGHHFSLNIFLCLSRNGKHGLYNTDVHRGVGLQYLQSWTEVQMMLLWWRFLWTSPGALCSGNCLASSADSQCHNKSGFITIAEYWKSGRSIHAKERRVKALRIWKG